MVFKLLLFTVLLYFVLRTVLRLAAAMWREAAPPAPRPEPPPRQFEPRPPAAAPPRPRLDVEDARWVDLPRRN